MSYRFTYIIEQDEDGIYVADVPQLPGCHTQAKSLDELKERVLEAIQLYLEDFNQVEQLNRFIGIQQIEATLNEFTSVEISKGG